MLITLEWPAPDRHGWSDLVALNMVGTETKLRIGNSVYKARVTDVQAGERNEPPTPPGVEVLGDFGYKSIIITIDTEGIERK